MKEGIGTSFEKHPQMKWRMLEMKDINKERGEIERVVREVFHFKESDPEFLPLMREIATSILNSKMEILDDEQWSRLENTDSWDIPSGNLKEAKKISDHYKKNITGILEGVKMGKPLPVPAILDYGKGLHLISGNTRLMTAKAFKQNPQVIFAKINPDNNPLLNQKTA